jgi:hypothetical protein
MGTRQAGVPLLLLSYGRFESGVWFIRIAPGSGFLGLLFLLYFHLGCRDRMDLGREKIAIAKSHPYCGIL